MVFGKWAFGLLLAGLLATGAAFAQDNNGAPRGPRGGGGGGGDWRQQAEQHMKDGLGVTDEEWKVLQPRIEKIQTLNRQLMAGVFGGRGGRGGRGGNDAQATSDAEQKAEALRATLENKDSKPDEVALKLKDLRAAREKAKQDLVKAKAELREIVTPRQEAYLALRGILD